MQALRGGIAVRSQTFAKCRTFPNVVELRPRKLARYIGSLGSAGVAGDTGHRDTPLNQQSAVLEIEWVLRFTSATLLPIPRSESLIIG